MNTDTELINSRIDIRAEAERAGAIFRGNRSCCPIHGGDNPAAFEVWKSGTRFTCHTREECNQYGHDGIALLRALNNWTFLEVSQRYAAGAQAPDPQEAARRAVENAKHIEKDLQRKIEEAQHAIEDLRKARRWIEDHDNMEAAQVAMWELRGIRKDWQNYWWLGYRENFSYFYDGRAYTSPSLTIPIYECNASEPIQVRHRIINPIDPGDKYRPEKSGIRALPFLGDRDLPIDAAERVIICEGEIKAAVVFSTLDRPLWQVIGVQGKKGMSTLPPELVGRKDTVIILDPDAKLEAVRLARSLGGARVVDLPDKIDDMIVKHSLGANWIDSIVHNARMVV